VGLLGQSQYNGGWGAGIYTHFLGLSMSLDSPDEYECEEGGPSDWTEKEGDGRIVGRCPPG
jgi:hypothetical protein